MRWRRCGGAHRTSATKSTPIARAPAMWVPRGKRKVCQKKGVPIDVAMSATAAARGETSLRMKLQAMHMAIAAKATFVHARTTAYSPPKPSCGPPIMCTTRYEGAERIDVPIHQWFDSAPVGVTSEKSVRPLRTKPAEAHSL